MGAGLFQPWHVIVIVAIILVLFGPSRLPGLGQSIGKSIRDFRGAIKSDEAQDDKPA
jgi:sec-independent protein translocase protein TatA